MKYVIGLFISVVGFILASKHLNQDIKEYWDFVAFFVVVLGTFAVMLITFPAIPAGYLVRRFAQKFFLPIDVCKKTRRSLSGVCDRTESTKIPID